LVIVGREISSRNYCLEMLKEIHRLIPEDVYLSTFIFENKTDVVLKGSAVNMPLVFTFARSLNESDLLSSAEIKYVTQRKIRESELTNFEIICKIKSGV
ncbi:MAG: PilN domain-containing protein, partial [Candidatus Omnitrophica bacterium]|nr:PilN domain-containing protein [Candidatus Omnitrophota bacterium]